MLSANPSSCRTGLIWIQALGKWALAVIMAAFIAAPAMAAQYASYILDVKSGQTLYAKNADTIVHPESLTKMMTLYLLFQELKAKRMTMDTKLNVSAHAAGQPPSNIGVAEGDKITVQQAILALVTKSANDVASVIAENLAPTEWEFAAVMTAKARELGMTRTVFRNASGLPDDGQVTSARDMATLALALMRDFPQYYPLFSTKSFVYEGKTFANHNHLLYRKGGYDGLKTGYIHASGFNLVTSAVRGNKRLIGVVMGGRTAAWRDDHMARLMDDGFRYGTTMASAGSAVKGAPKGDGKIAVAAATPAPAVPDRGEKTWGLQIGAYSQRAPAFQAASQAMRNASGLLTAARVVVTEVGVTTGKLYRARIVGLSSKRAKDACTLLISRQMKCFVLNPTQIGQLAAAD
ncbi:MAG: D-alanyl-D-alanine carboxypeptidase family protein [Alphaproteobacteria bacterium]